MSTATLLPPTSHAPAGVPFSVGTRVEAHPHRPKVKAGEARSLSVRALPDGHVAYVHQLVLRDAQFVVHSSGHARAAREQVRNVHAWVRGHLATVVVDPANTGDTGDLTCTAGTGGGAWVRVTYNPFLSSTFRVSTLDPDTGERALGASVVAARLVMMRGAECWALDPTYA